MSSEAVESVSKPSVGATGQSMRTRSLMVVVSIMLVLVSVTTIVASLAVVSMIMFVASLAVVSTIMFVASLAVVSTIMFVVSLVPAALVIRLGFCVSHAVP